MWGSGKEEMVNNLFLNMEEIVYYSSNTITEQS